MNVKISALALVLLGSAALAATATVWTEDGPGTMAPASWYTYTSGTGASVDTMTTAANVKVAEFAVTPGKTENSAGLGLIWRQDPDKDYADVPVSLANYKGVCLSYRATAPFRMDFKQSTITDYNYYGADLAAGSKRTFIAFSGLKQGWTSKTTVAWNVGKQTGVQFAYKNTHATTSVYTNTVEIVSFILADECENHAPNLVDGVSATVAKDLYEGDTLQVAFKEIFEDADGDDLNITMALSGYAQDLVGSKSYSMSDIAKIKSKANPIDSTEATAIFTAKDPAGKSVTYTVKLNLIDRKNAPVAVDDNYEMNEDAVLTVASSKGIKLNDYDDDGDKAFDVTIKTEPAHGEFTFNGNGFVYTPNPNFYGTDQFTYTITDASDLTSNPATVTITVKNVEDPATITITDSTFRIGSASADPVKFADGIEVNEDFEDFDIFIAMDAFDISDPDVLTSNFPINVASKNGLVDVMLDMTTTNYVISLIAVPNANGEDAIQLFIIDDKDTVGFSIPLTIEAVADKPKAVDDTYSVLQDTVTVVSAAKGVLKNDLNPDGASALKAFLLTEASHGTVTLDTTGAFRYEVGAYEGEDSFTYFIVNADGDTSDVATVTLDVSYRNRAPQVVAGIAESLKARFADLNEDFTSQFSYTLMEMKGWFTDPDGDAFDVTVANPDSILHVEVNTSKMVVKSVKDACGDATLVVTATDKNKNSTALQIPVPVTCVNDRPTRYGLKDTVYVPISGWQKVFYVFDLFEDVDDSVLVMKTTKVHPFLFAEIVGDSLYVRLIEERLALQYNVAYEVRVTVTDEAGETSPAKELVFVSNPTPIPVVANAPKAGWQGAITADHGMAVMFDMQGRVMWQHRLPVSEDAVRNAAAKVQGRKILQVNRQTWTIK
ncbi:MAG: tandem-95 repeat protein [Fibrobacter sp.]|nr:tandem-95 repeat protein [Fibrobacter sp.]